MISKPTRWLLSPDIHLSITLLADSLQHAGFQIFNRPFNIDWGSSPWLVNRMTESGWCIYAISTLLEGQQLQNLHYASTLGRPLIRRSHNDCDKSACTWEQLDKTTYQTQHRLDCAGCPMVDSTEARSVDLIRQGHTPMVAYNEVDGLGVLDVRSRERENEEAHYVAISHVCRYIVRSREIWANKDCW